MGLGGWRIIRPRPGVAHAARTFSETKSPYQSVVIVEFKRPAHNEYPARVDNPVEQVLRNVRKIKEGTAKDKDGKTLNVGLIPFCAYFLCSLPPRIKAMADDHDFVKTPDNEGYFRYHQSAGSYMEIVSDDTVLNDAKKRNRAFFERLRIPMCQATLDARCWSGRARRSSPSLALAVPDPRRMSNRNRARRPTAQGPARSARQGRSHHRHAGRRAVRQRPTAGNDLQAARWQRSPGRQPCHGRLCGQDAQAQAIGPDGIAF
jgi:hypothetical protein